MTQANTMEALDGAGEFAIELGAGGVGFVLADGLDRLLATYDPAASGEKPKDKFTSDGAGTLANSLNVGSAPGAGRIAAGVALTALPAVGAAVVEDPLGQAALEGLALGAGISVFKTLWNNVVMPLFIGKDDATPAGLQKSYIARLYPAEVAAKINRSGTPPQTAVSSGGGAGALSGPPLLGMGSRDVGPFALASAGDDQYPDASQALRRQAGVQDFPSLENTWGTGDYPTTAQALRRQTGAVAGVISEAAPEVHPVQAGHAAAEIATSPTPHVESALVRAGVDPARAAQVAPYVAYRVLLLLSPAPPAPPPGVTGWQPGPPSDVGPGPQAEPHTDPSCGCIGDDNQYLGFVGDEAPASDFSPLWSLDQVAGTVASAGGSRRDDRW